MKFGGMYSLLYSPVWGHGLRVRNLSLELELFVVFLAHYICAVEFVFRFKPLILERLIWVVKGIVSLLDFMLRKVIKLVFKYLYSLQFKEYFLNDLLKMSTVWNWTSTYVIISFLFYRSNEKRRRINHKLCSDRLPMSRSGSKDQMYNN